jgi:hypothetical protein
MVWWKKPFEYWPRLGECSWGGRAQGDAAELRGRFISLREKPHPLRDSNHSVRWLGFLHPSDWMMDSGTNSLLWNSSVASLRCAQNRKASIVWWKKPFE